MAALVFTGCQKDVVLNEVPQDQPIAFGTYLGRDAQTKASELTTESMKTNGFGVYAYYTTSDWNSATGKTPNFMNNQLVKYETSSWTYSPTKYWPKNSTDRLSFFAYAPYSLTSPVTTNNNQVPFLNVTVDQDITKHIDYTYAVENWTATGTPVSLYNLTSSAGQIELLFKHAMSRVGFTVKHNLPNVNDGQTSISVSSIKIDGTFVKTNSFTLDEGTWGTGITDSYEFNLGSSNLDVNSSNGSTVNKNNSYLFLIPQENSEFTIEVAYTITTKDPAYDSGPSAGDGKVEFSNTVETSTITHTFVAGKAYNFVLTVGLDAITFNAEVDSNWNSSDVTVTGNI